MAPEEEVKKRVARKLTKKRKENQVNMEVPERFQDGDDADEDSSAIPGGNPLMNHSIFGLMVAVGSQVEVNSRFDAQSSDEEGDMEQSSELQVDKTRPVKADKAAGKPEKHHRRKFSEHRLLRSIPRLGSRSKSSSNSNSKSPRSESPHIPESSSEPTASEVQTPRTKPNHAPYMSRMLEARAELSMRPSSDIPRRSIGGLVGQDEDEKEPSNLAKKLMEIFGFETAEDVIEEYPCWLLKSVLLQGYMYITSKHICFYAYLPKKSNEVVKSGYISKSGKRNPKFNRYWFRLKGDVLSYYSDPSDLYFPAGNIDLRYGISAKVVDKGKGKDATYFTVVTHERNFNFKADSIPSAKEWVKALQKIIFRSHNDGDSVKISLPIENVLDIEDCHMLDFADTCKIRVIDNDETYAIDEYFFSFFSFGREALSVLQILVEDTPAQQIPEDLLTPPPMTDGKNSPRASTSKRNSLNLLRDTRIPPPKPSPIRTDAPLLGDSVHATLSPILQGAAQSPRASTDLSRASSDAFRRSVDLSKFGRRSVDLNRLNFDGAARRSVSASRRSLSRNRLGMGDRRNSEKQGSSDSYVHSLEEPGSSGALPSASEGTQASASASQILRGSDVFLSPTIQRSASAIRRRNQAVNNETLDDSSNRTMPRDTSKSPTMPPPRHANTTGSMAGSPADQEGPSLSAPTLQTLAKASAYPLQQAAGFAGYLNKHTKRMSNMLATESMGYVEKVSGMWKGGKKHYGEHDGLASDDQYEDDDEEAAMSGNRFREYFALPETETLQAHYFCYLHRGIPVYGKIYLSDRSFCFRSLFTRTKLVLPLKDIENVTKETGWHLRWSQLVLVIRGREEIFFEFTNASLRDDCAVTLIKNLETMRYLKESGILSAEDEESALNAVAENNALQQARVESKPEHTLKMPQSAEIAPPILFDDPRASILNFKPPEPLRITCLTIGSRGDVQPYIALCKGLQAEGHRPRIVSHAEFKDMVEGHGIEFRPIAGDPGMLMKLCVENVPGSITFIKEAWVHMRPFIAELLTTSWKACQDTDLLIESPSAMAGIHIAEALKIPYFRAMSMPWTRTRSFPHSFGDHETKRGGVYNLSTYTFLESSIWFGSSFQINPWRKKVLGLPPTNLAKMQPNMVPFLYSFSPSVVIPPLDYSDWIRVTGYWFLDEAGDYKPPKELMDFIQKARDDEKKLVYIGFGSITIPNSAAFTKDIVESVLKADVRCILSKGWSDRMEKSKEEKPEKEAESAFPPEIFSVKSVPHDWLFTQVDAAVHHGGAGTTGASLRAGLPTIIKPWFGDQFFFGSRVEDLGVGIRIRKMNVSVFSRALWQATHDLRLITKARVLGESIRSEDGVGTAIQSIYRNLDYARSLIKSRDKKMLDDTEEPEESWTFIGDESDPEILSRLQNWEAMAQSKASGLETGTDDFASP